MNYGATASPDATMSTSDFPSVDLFSLFMTELSGDTQVYNNKETVRSQILGVDGWRYKVPTIKMNHVSSIIMHELMDKWGNLLHKIPNIASIEVSSTLVINFNS